MTVPQTFFTALINLPSDRCLPDTNETIPFHFIGDEAFPLNEQMMRPFPGRTLTNDRRIFNYRLSRARRCIENAFGILVNRFRIFRRSINAHPKCVEQIVLGNKFLNYIDSDCVPLL